MKLNRTLNINQSPRQIIAERIMLDLFSPGRAEFTVVTAELIKANQLVTFDMGYSQQASMQRWFIGMTETVVPVGDKQVKVFCRELSSALSHSLPLNLRHVSLRDVLAEINTITGLNFATPDQSYSTTKVANFFNVGSGYQAMALLGRVFNIPDFMWQQQSGVIYVGSWADSRWASIKNMALPANLFDGQSVNESAMVAAMPILRPGVRINGNRITAIDFQQNKMTLSWKK